jgi:hypothetical protein
MKRSRSPSLDRLSFHPLPFFHVCKVRYTIENTCRKAMTQPVPPPNTDLVYMVEIDTEYEGIQLRRTEAKTFGGILVPCPRPLPVCPRRPGNFRITVRWAEDIIEVAAPRDGTVGALILALALFLRLTPLLPDRLHLMVDDKAVNPSLQLSEARIFNLGGTNEVRLTARSLRPTPPLLAPQTSQSQQ